MQYDIDQPVTRDPETDPGAEFKERSIGTAFDILRSVRDTCHMAMPNEKFRVGHELHPVTNLRDHLSSIIDASRVEVQYEQIEERVIGDGEYHKRVRQGEDPGAHLNLSVRVWDANGHYDDYALHINTVGGGIAGRRITEADFHDAARYQGARNHARRTEDSANPPLEMNVVIKRGARFISDVTVETSTIPNDPNRQLRIVPAVASLVYATETDEILLLGDAEENVNDPVRKKHVDQAKINGVNSDLIAQARELYRLRDEAAGKVIERDVVRYNFTSISSLPGVHSTALSA